MQISKVAGLELAAVIEESQIRALHKQIKKKLGSFESLESPCSFKFRFREPLIPICFFLFLPNQQSLQHLNCNSISVFHNDLQITLANVISPHILRLLRHI